MIQIKVNGIANTRSFLLAASNAVSKAANDAIIQSGFFVQGEVVQSIAGFRAEHMSVDTGRFKNSVKAEQLKPLTSTISSNVIYGPFLEYGTSKMQPRYHFTNTAKRNEIKVKDFIEKAIKNVTG